MQIHERARPIDFAEMQQRLETHGIVRHNDFVLKFWRDPYEMTLFPDGRAIIKGTTDTGSRTQSVRAFHWQLEHWHPSCFCSSIR